MLVGECVKLYAMVGISVRLVKLRTGNARSENRRGAFFHEVLMEKKMLLLGPSFALLIWV